MPGPNSDNSLLCKELGWEPEVTLEGDNAETYAWIWEQLGEQGRAEAPKPGAQQAVTTGSVQHIADRSAVKSWPPLSRAGTDQPAPVRSGY